MQKHTSLLALCLAVASSTASAQVYRSTDADGNTVFSDRPMPGSVEIDVEPPNAADPLVIPVAPTEPPDSQQLPPATPQAAEDNEDSYEDDERKVIVDRPGHRWRRVGPRHPRIDR